MISYADSDTESRAKAVTEEAEEEETTETADGAQTGDPAMPFGIMSLVTAAGAIFVKRQQ